jgi:hypothetical protein
MRKGTASDLARAASWGLPVIVAAVTLFFAFPGSSSDSGEPLFVAVTLALVAVTLVVGIVRRLATMEENRSRKWEHDADLLKGSLSWFVVLAWSLVVRFGLTEANVLTDGGSGYGRLMQGDGRFSGVSVLVQAVMPASLEGMMWPSIFVPRVVAALAPALLTVVARQIGVERRVALLSGLALASYPLHAAMFSSDFLAGSSPTFALLGFALILAGRSDGGEGWFAAGVLTLAYSLWIRPDTSVAVAPAAIAVFLFPPRFWVRPATVVPLAWLIGTVLVYVLTFDVLLETLGGRELTPGGPWTDLPFLAFAAHSAVLPWWLWIPVVPGVRFLRGTARWVALAGLLFGLAAAHLGTPGDPSTDTWMEVFRYGVAAMPWLALLSAAGLVGLTDRLSVFAATYFQRPSLRVSLQRALFAAAVLAVVVTPLANRDYLARRYQNTVDEQAFLAALRVVPADCGLVVPDDEASSGEVFVRYRYMVEEAVRRRELDMDPLRVVGLDEFRSALRKVGRLPRYSEVEMRRYQVLADDAGPSCWYFYEGTYCAPGLPNFPTTRCHEFLDVEPHRQVATWPVEFWSHRLISRPDLRVPPFYDPRRVLALYELTDR